LLPLLPRLPAAFARRDFFRQLPLLSLHFLLHAAAGRRLVPAGAMLSLHDLRL
jgi:hypothetical protein